MQQEYRLTKTVKFRQIRNEGQCRANSLLVLCILPNDIDSIRVGISVNVKLGKATVRNRVKRLVREAVRPLIPQLRHGFDLLFIARKGMAQASFAQVVSAVGILLQRSGISSKNVDNMNMTTSREEF